MKLREQATLWCKILGLFCVVMAVSSLQSSLAQMSSLIGTRGATPGVGALLMASAPAILMGAFGGGIWLVSPFLAALMVPDATLQRLENAQESETATSGFNARDALKIALILLGLWAWLRSASSVGNSFVLRAALESVPAATRNSMASYYNFQINLGWMSAVLEFGFGLVVFLLSRWLPRRIFPAS